MQVFRADMYSQPCPKQIERQERLPTIVSPQCVKYPFKHLIELRMIVYKYNVDLMIHYPYDLAGSFLLLGTKL